MLNLGDVAPLPKDLPRTGAPSNVPGCDIQGGRCGDSTEARGSCAQARGSRRMRSASLRADRQSGRSAWWPPRSGMRRLPELEEEPAEGSGEPRTIERPRVRARFVDQGEPARPPGEGRRHDPMPPSSPGETSAGQSTLSEAAVPVGGEAEARPRPKKRHQKRLQRPSGDARLANKRANQGEPEPREGGR